MTGFLTRVLKNRVVQFLGLGGLIFGLAPTNEVHDTKTVHISQAQFDAVVAAQARRQGTAHLSKNDSQAVLDGMIESEVLYREALRLGLDLDDHIVRQRLVQKVLLLAEDLSGAAAPLTEAGLHKYFEAHRSNYRQPETVTFRHIFATTAHREKLKSLTDVGDAFPLPTTVIGESFDKLANQYGSTFARSVRNAPLHEWSKPLASKFGWHIVQVDSRTDARLKTFEEAKGEATLDYLRDRKQYAADAYLKKLMDSYRIEIDSGIPVSGHSVTLTTQLAWPPVSERGED